MKKNIIYFLILLNLFLISSSNPAMSEGMPTQRLFEAQLLNGKVIKPTVRKDSEIIEKHLNSNDKILDNKDSINFSPEATTDSKSQEVEETSAAVQPGEDENPDQIDSVSTVKEARVQKYWRVLKGKPAKDGIKLGMYSYHSNVPNIHDFNGKNNMIAAQYKGITAGYFKNSFFHDAYYFGVSREVYSKKLLKHVDFDVTYKAGGLYGYFDRYPNIFNVTPIAMPYFGLTVYGVGADFCVIPSDRPIFTVNFRVNKPDISSLLKRRDNNL